ncbi:MAG: RNA methyltransferase [bacterium]
MSSKVYIALIHYPVYNKSREIIASSISTSSIHDIARTCKTFGVKNFFIITPLLRQQKLIETIINHWRQGYGATYNPTRGVALETIYIINTLEDCIHRIKTVESQSPKIVVTGAQAKVKCIEYDYFREMLHTSMSTTPILLLFGTGWGMEDSIFLKADLCLKPIKGQGNYNHLSVRAAVSIILDRLLAEKI